MAVEFESHSTSTRAARNDDDEKASSERRGTRRVALTRESRAHFDGRAGGIIGDDDDTHTGGDSDGYEEIRTR